MAAEIDDWFPSTEDIYQMLRDKAPHLPVSDMTIGEVWIALGQDQARPPCPHCECACLVFIDGCDGEGNTHRCDECGQGCRWEETPCA